MRDAEGYPRRWSALVVLCVSVLIVNVDNTILNVALPTLVRTLHATSSQLQWIVDSYAVVFAGLLLVGGSLADRFGRKRFFLTGLTVFVTGSVGAAFCGSVNALIAWRALMGAGAALTMPSTLSIINDMFRDPAERARAIGAWAGTSGLGIAIGPIAGGLLLSSLLVGLGLPGQRPDCAQPASSALWRSCPTRRSRSPTAQTPWDPCCQWSDWGCCSGPSSRLPAVVGRRRRSSESARLSIAVLATFVGWEWRTRYPMMPLSFFSDRRFSIAAAGEMLGVFGLFGALFIQTQYLQFDLGYSALQAGLRILPIAAVLALTAPLSPLLAHAVGAKSTVGAGLLAIAGGLWQISLVSRCWHDVHAGAAGHDAHRIGRGPLDADGDELRGGIRAARRRRGGLGKQRCRDPGRRGSRRRRAGQRLVHSLPGSPDRRPGRSHHAGGGVPCDPRLPRRSTHGCQHRGRVHGCLAGSGGAGRVHERIGTGSRRGCRCRVGGCPARDRPASFRHQDQLSDRPANTHRPTRAAR